MSRNPGFQISLDVKGRPCLILGGGDEAAEKAQRLLQAGAKVTVIHPTLNEALRRLTASAKVIHRGRLFRATDTEGILLVINTTRDPDLSRSLLELAQKERFLVCSTDQPDLSTVSMPALASRGYLRIAISTSGVAPALASKLRQNLEEIVDEDLEPFLDWLAAIRDETMKQESDAGQRRDRLRNIVAEFRLIGQIQYPPAWLEQRATQAGSQRG
jgi:precorrin-2 dehydrogenase/sirohydrochlorin ferrochelatase